MPVYLKLGDLQGETTDARYRGYIELVACSLGPVGRSISTPTGGQQGQAQHGNKSFSEVQITKRVDKLTAKLFQAAALGTMFPQATLIFPQWDPAFGVLLMYKVYITAVQVGGGHGPDPALENYALQFDDMTWASEAGLKTLQTIVRAFGG